ncbi:MAG: terminase small subunit [Verrucomicrobiota bacterium]
MVSICHSDCLNDRQHRFVTLVASGVPAGRAYEQAGYKSRGNAADVGGSKLVRNPKVAEALQRERDLGLKASRLDRNEKLGILEEIARNATAPARERIAAIKVHNEMTGEATGSREESRAAVILDIEKRAKEVASGLARVYQEPS